MGHAYNAWWTGSDLSIEESRRLVPHQNATTDAGGHLGGGGRAVDDRPTRGAASACPTQLPHDFILKIARPYLGKNLSLAADWTPLRHIHDAFGPTAAPRLRFRRPMAVQKLSNCRGDVMRNARLQTAD